MNKDLTADIERLNLKISKTIYSNERKKRHTLLVENQNKMNILKWNHPDEYTHLNKLKKEIEFYKQNKDQKYLPNLNYTEENLLLIDYMAGKTLREWMINYVVNLKEDRITKEFETVINGLIDFFKSFYLNPDGIVDNNKAVSSLKTYFYKLYYSSPMSITKSKIENLLLKVNAKIFRKNIDKKFEEIKLQLKNKNIQLKRYKIHSDLHLNNILVAEKDSEVKILDWENITTGTILEDLNYLYCFIIFLLKDLPYHQQYACKKLDEFFESSEPNLKEIFFCVNNLFLAGISVNRSFGHKLTFKYFIKALLQFNSKLNKQTEQYNF